MAVSLKSANVRVENDWRQPQRVRLLLAAAALIAILPRTTVAEEPVAAEFYPQPTEQEARLEVALGQRVEMDFSEAPLADMAAWCEANLEHSVQLDHRALEDAGVGSDTPVTRHVKDVTLRTALQLVLDDLDLTTIERDGMLVITTQDKAETELLTRIYPVGDLLEEVPVCTGESPARPAPNHLAPPPPSQQSPQGGGMFAVADDAPGAHPPRGDQPADAPATVSRTPRTKPDFDPLIEVITTTVRPQTWDQVGGPASISRFAPAKSLVISQTRPDHDKVLELLRALRAAKRLSDNQ